MVVACSVLSLARERGFRYVAQLESSGVMKVGFLDKPEDDPAKVVGAEFNAVASSRKYDAEQFAAICDLTKKEN